VAIRFLLEDFSGDDRLNINKGSFGACWSEHLGRLNFASQNAILNTVEKGQVGKGKPDHSSPEELCSSHWVMNPRQVRVRVHWSWADTFSILGLSSQDRNLNH